MKTSKRFALLSKRAERSGITPFRVFRSGLYNAASLYEGYHTGDPDSYKDCYDGKVYEHYLAAGKQTGDIKETLVRILHDHSINDGIDDFLGAFEEKSVVGVMGGHGLSRCDESYRKVVMLSKRLTEGGSLMVFLDSKFWTEQQPASLDHRLSR